MDKIIKKEFIKQYGEVRGLPVPQAYDWSLQRGAFSAGWKACLDWQEEQEILEIEKDVLYQQDGAREGR